MNYFYYTVIIINMKYYLIYLGESYHDNEIVAEWSKLFYGSEDECISMFLDILIEAFSSYGQNYGDIEIKDIKHSNDNFNIKSDGKYLLIETFEKKYCYNCFWHKNSKNGCDCNVLGNNKKEYHVLSYGVSGGLHLDMYAFLLPENSEIIFVRDISPYRSYHLQPIKDNNNYYDWLYKKIGPTITDQDITNQDITDQDITDQANKLDFENNCLTHQMNESLDNFINQQHHNSYLCNNIDDDVIYK